MSETLSDSELRALWGVVEEGRRDEPTEGLPWSVLHGLAGLIRCDNVSFTCNDHRVGRVELDQWIEADDEGAESGQEDHPEEYWIFKNQFLVNRSRDLSTAFRWSDLYTRTQLISTPFYTDFLRPVGIENGMHATLPSAPGRGLKVSFFRDLPTDFTDRDLLVIQLLRPHLYELHLASQRRLNGVPTLSKREWDVLLLVNEGYGNSEIAQALFISIATVRKHLEHIYDRTGARTRLAAAALMIPHYHASREKYA